MVVCMRECLRCRTIMVDNLNVMVSNGQYGIDVREKGIFKWSLGKIRCAVCPNCGSLHIFHTVCGECGYYRGKVAIEKAVEE